MPAPASPHTGRKKVRCPKCTARFSEPSKPVFDCPICATQLSAKEIAEDFRVGSNGLLANNSAVDKEAGKARAGDDNFEQSETHSPARSFEDDGFSAHMCDTTREQDSIAKVEEGEAFPAQSLKKNELPTINNTDENPSSVVKIDNKGLQLTTAEDDGVTDGNDGRIEQATVINTDFNTSSDHMAKNDGITEVRHDAAEDDAVEGQDHEVKEGLVDSSSWTLQSQILRNIRYDFSFKYSLENASPLEAGDRPLQRKKSPRTRTLLAETTIPDSEANVMPLSTPLRIRISNSHRDSSDQSDDDGYSFGSEVDSHDGSESDFDFPAPSPEQLQEIRLPASFGQSVRPDSSRIVSAMPHQLELVDSDELFKHGEDAIQGPRKHFEESQVELPVEVEDAGRREGRVSNAQESEHSPGSDFSASERAFVANQPDPGVIQDGNHAMGMLLKNETSPLDDSFRQAHGNEPEQVFAGRDQEANSNRAQGTIFHQFKSRKAVPNSDSQSALDVSMHDGEQSLKSSSPSSRGDVTSAVISNRDERKLEQSFSSDETHSIASSGQSNLTLRQVGLVRGSQNMSGKSRLHHGMMRAGTSKELDLYPQSELHFHVGKGQFPFVSESQLPRRGNGEDLIITGLNENRRGCAPSPKAFVQPTYELVDWEGDKSCEQDVRSMGRNPSQFSYHPINNMHDFSHLASQSYAFTNHHFIPDHFSSGSAGPNQFHPYHGAPQSAMLPDAVESHALTHYKYHQMFPICTFCSHHQHAHTQAQQIPHCAFCFSQTGSIAYNSGHWNRHGMGSAYASSLSGCSQANSSGQRHDMHNTEPRSHALSAQKINEYPPLPKYLAAPYVTCKGCNRVLQVPRDLPLSDVPTQKLRCGACGKVSKFSVPQHRRFKLPALEVDSMGGATKILPVVQYSTHEMVSQSGISSHRQDLVTVSPMSHWSYEHPFNTNFPQTNSDTRVQIPQGESSRSQHRISEFDTPLNVSGNYNISCLASTACSSLFENATTLSSPKNEVLRAADSFDFQRSKINPSFAAPFHSTVDEKEEGLDFGAPRISDGDSLDHSESRLRSPENNQGVNLRPFGEAFHEVPQRGHQSSWRSEREAKQTSEVEDNSAAQGKKPGSPLLVLLNQESTRFSLNLEPRVPLQCSERSPAFASYFHSHNSPNRREENAQGASLSKGPKYIAGLLRRSLRDFGKGGQK